MCSRPRPRPATPTARKHRLASPANAEWTNVPPPPNSPLTHIFRSVPRTGSYCFRWAQFIGDTDLRFAQKDAGSLFDYLAEHEEVSDILFTGGDPMIMKTNMFLSVSFHGATASTRVVSISR